MQITFITQSNVDNVQKLAEVINCFNLVADGGVSKTGNIYKYYACKNSKKGLCGKNRENKNHVEKWLTTEVVNFFKDPKRIAKVVDDLITYHERKTGESEAKAIEAKITHANRQIEATLNSLIVSESITTKKLLDKKINELTLQVEALELQKKQLEIEQGLPLTRQDLIEFIAEFTNGDPIDKEFQERLIDNLVTTVYLYDDQITVYFSVGNRMDTIMPTLEKSRNAIKKEEATEPTGSTTSAFGGGGGIRTPVPLRATGFQDRASMTTFATPPYGYYTQSLG